MASYSSSSSSAWLGLVSSLSSTEIKSEADRGLPMNESKQFEQPRREVMERALRSVLRRESREVEGLGFVSQLGVLWEQESPVLLCADAAGYWGGA